MSIIKNIFFVYWKCKWSKRCYSVSPNIWNNERAYIQFIIWFIITYLKWKLWFFLLKLNYFDVINQLITEQICIHIMNRNLIMKHIIQKLKITFNLSYENI